MESDPQSLSVEHILNESRVFPPSPEVSEKAQIAGLDSYRKMYDLSLRDPDMFWRLQAKTLSWMREPTVICKYLWNPKGNEVRHTWFEDGIMNVCANCLDRHIEAGKGDKTAILWQGDTDQETTTLTYKELLTAVCKFANVLKKLGINKRDRVCIYLPMIPEVAIAMLACARIGAIHSVVYGGFSAESLNHRINDSESKLLITANTGLRGGKEIPFKDISDEALMDCPTIRNVIVVRRNDSSCNMQAGRDVWYHEEMGQVDSECPPEKMSAEDPLFILYTSGSTGKPKGVVHTQAGYLLYASLTHRYVFDLHDDDIYWCTADVGWITGHSYIVYGPLANQATTLMFEGIPTWPDCGRFWQIVEKYKVSIFYTAPTAIRTLIRHGDELPAKYDLSSLRILGTVGEPINPEAWMWYYDVIGRQQCPVVDTWWQTETGGIMITPLPGCHSLKPGSAIMPFFGVDPAVVREDGTSCERNEGGSLCIRRPWPGIMRTTWGDHQRFIDTYFKTFEKMYYTGDGCRVDEDGCYWLLGRIDDVVNISGHRMGTAEVESALVSHEAVAEAAVVAYPHQIKGQALHAFVTLVQGAKESRELADELRLHVRKEVGPIAIPDIIQYTDAFPKTRSGKIMRRLLRKIAEKEISELGDTSTLADAKVLEDLIQGEKMEAG